MLIGLGTITFLAESLTILSFIIGGVSYAKKQSQKEHEKLKVILEKIVTRDKKQDDLLESIVKKIHQQDTKLTDIIEHLNRIDIYLAKSNTDYGNSKINQPIFRN
jgi:hypothetical protein